MTSELNLPTESFSGIQTNASLVETRASVVTLVTEAAEPSLLEMWPHVSTLLDRESTLQESYISEVWPWISFAVQLNRTLGVVYSWGSAVLLTEGENFIQDNPVAPSKIRRFQFSLVCFGCFCVFVYSTTQSKQFRYLDVPFVSVN